MRIEAGMAAVEKLNKRYRLAKFRYHRTAGVEQMNMAYTADSTLRFTQRRSNLIANFAVTYLYNTFE